MTDTFVAQTDGAGTKVHAFTRTVGGQTVAEEVLVLGHSGMPSSHGTLLSTHASNLAGSGSTFPYYLANIWPVFVGATGANRYADILRITVQQIVASTVAASIPIALVIETGGLGDGSANDFLYQQDTQDGNITEVWSLGGSQALGSLRRLATIATLTVPITTGLPTRLNSDRWQAGHYTKPIRVGPGQALQLGLWQLEPDRGSPGASVRWNAEALSIPY